MSIFGKLFEKETPLQCLRRLAKAYDPRGGEADSLQGALADVVLCLRDEGTRNGWLNGRDFHAECVDLIKKYICDQPTGVFAPERDRIARDLEAIRDAALGGALQGRFAYEELDHIQIDVARWCQANPKPILRPVGQDFW